MPLRYPKIDPPEGAERYWPPGAPPWPVMFRHRNGDISVPLKHPTPFLKSMGTGIGCLVLAFVPLFLPLLFFAPNTDAAGGSVCFLYVVALFVGAFGLERAGSYLGSVLNGTTCVMFTSSAVTVEQGKKQVFSRQRLPHVKIAFRAVELPDLNRRAMGKGPKLRADLADQRIILMVYGSETLTVTTMLDKEDAMQFVAALNTARDESAKSFANPTAPESRGPDSPPDLRDLAE